MLARSGWFPRSVTGPTVAPRSMEVGGGVCHFACATQLEADEASDPRSRDVAREANEPSLKKDSFGPFASSRWEAMRSRLRTRSRANVQDSTDRVSVPRQRASRHERIRARLLASQHLFAQQSAAPRPVSTQLVRHPRRNVRRTPRAQRNTQSTSTLDCDIHSTRQAERKKSLKLRERIPHPTGGKSVRVIWTTRPDTKGAPVPPMQTTYRDPRQNWRLHQRVGLVKASVGRSHRPSCESLDLRAVLKFKTGFAPFLASECPSGRS